MYADNIQLVQKTLQKECWESNEMSTRKTQLFCITLGKYIVYISVIQTPAIQL